MPTKIAILGEFSPTFAPHIATNEAIKHSSAYCGIDVEHHWISTADIDATLFENFSGIWIAPGSPYKDMEKTIWAIQYARKNMIPCIGTCGGFQHMIIEYARNVLGFEAADHEEYSPATSNPLFISRLTCSLVGKELVINLLPGSRAEKVYGSTSTTERYYCNFGVNPTFAPILRGEVQPSSGATLTDTTPQLLLVTGADAEGEVRVIEAPAPHPFFVGTLFVPQALSQADKPHPLVSEFLRAAKRA